MRDDGEIRQFITTARRFCGFVEGVDNLSAGEIVIQAAPLLAELYAQALTLPEGPPADDEVEAERVSAERHHQIMQVIDGKLGEYAVYWSIFDPYKDPVDDNYPVQGTMGDDIADVYRDLKNGLAIYDIGTDEACQEAFWQCKFNFGNHWGRHLVSALNAMHALLFTEYIGLE